VLTVDDISIPIAEVLSKDCALSIGGRVASSSVPCSTSILTVEMLMFFPPSLNGKDIHLVS
jgi:hypothetical protein